MADIVIDPPVRLMPQWDGRWNTQPAVSTEKWGWWGPNCCGPTSLAIILRWYAEDNPSTKGKFKFPKLDGSLVKPDRYPMMMCEAFWPKLKGQCFPSQNTIPNEQLQKLVAKYCGMSKGMKIKDSPSLATIAEALADAKGPVMLLMFHHFVVCTGVENGQLLIVDPGNVLSSRWTEAKPGKRVPPKDQWPGGHVPGYEGDQRGYVAVHPTKSKPMTGPKHYATEDKNGKPIALPESFLASVRWVYWLNVDGAKDMPAVLPNAELDKGDKADAKSDSKPKEEPKTAPAGDASKPADPIAANTVQHITEGDFSIIPIQLAGGDTGKSPKRPTKGSQVVWGGVDPSSPWAHLIAQIEKGGGKVNYTLVHAATIDKNKGAVKISVAPSEAATTPADPGEGPNHSQVDGGDNGQHVSTTESSSTQNQGTQGTQGSQGNTQQNATPPAVGTGPLFEKGKEFAYETSKARVWAHPKTKGTGPRPLIVYLHGNNKSGEIAPALNAQHMGKLVTKLIDDGKVTPLVMAAPTHKAEMNSASTPWKLWDPRAFKLDAFVAKVVEQCKSEGVEIDLDNVSVTGHSGAGGGAGHGMNKVAEGHGKFTVDGAEHKLKVFGIMDTGLGSARSWKEGLASNDKTEMYVVHRGSGGWGDADYNSIGGSVGLAKALSCTHNASSLTGGDEDTSDCVDAWDNQGSSPGRISLKIDKAKLPKYRTLWKAAGGFEGPVVNDAHWNMVPMWTWWALPRFFKATEQDKQAQSSAQAGTTTNNQGAGTVQSGSSGNAGSSSSNTTQGTVNSGSGNQNTGDQHTGSGVSGGEFNIPPPPAPWTNPAGDIGPKACAAPFADPGSAIYWPIRGKGVKGRIVCYIGEDSFGYGTIRENGKTTASGRNFLASRDSGARYHVGVDLYGDYNDLVVAIEPGTIKAFYSFYLGVYALFVQCDSGLVINYGEVDKLSMKEFKLSTGMQVAAGQPIGRVGRMTGGSSMLHFETYPQGTKSNQHHYPKSPESNLRDKFLNPTQYLLSLAKNGK